MNIRNWVLGAVFLAEGVSVNAQQAPQSFYAIQKAQMGKKSYPIPNGRQVTKNVIDVSYDELVEYACDKWKEVKWDQLGEDEQEREDRKERILRKMRLLTFAGPEFVEKVLPKDITDSKKLFVIDPKLKNGVPQLTQVEFEFIKEILKAILGNPVGEARVKSILLLSCLQEAGLIGGGAILSKIVDKEGVEKDVFQDQIVVNAPHGFIDDLEKSELGGTLEDNTLQIYPIYSSIPYIYNLSQKNKMKDRFDEINSIVNEMKNLLKTCEENYNTKNQNTGFAEEFAKKVKQSNELQRGFRLIASTLIHEMSHIYHRYLGFGETLVSENNSFLSNCMKVHSDMEVYWGDAASADSWNSTPDEMLAILGLCPYKDGNEKFIIEDRVNENTARFYAKEPLRYWHIVPLTKMDLIKAQSLACERMNKLLNVLTRQESVDIDQYIDQYAAQFLADAKRDIMLGEDGWKQELENSLFKNGTADCLNNFYISIKNAIIEDAFN